MVELYDAIGVNYDTSRKADPQITQRLISHLDAAKNSQVLDVGCGTGNYTIALSRLGLTMTGTDISEEMLHTARKKPSQVTWDKADVLHLPYQDGAFSGATCILAIHHFKNLHQAFQQVYRVISQGRFVIFTSSPEQMERYWLTEYFPDAMHASCRQMPEIPLAVDHLRKLGFSIVGVEKFFIQPDLQDFFLYSGKHEPSIYLNPNVRAGISTFPNLASRDEIHIGCTRLKIDIESGRIQEVMDRYRSDLGDYLFVIAEKR
ncbi:class I SAM-dependent methyltransferase [Paenibacillus xerothermodurans]|uniref:Class I SAM-dependent methyltransferase n=1 Tax=Paenibacillus xerothermodurans TaxID=1977292 RepID=A0A2W1NW23_PAEXE|nr:class I SAM-dependent methyltransferase [Paenibacillus xerothermodurans]PZE19902.1 class I SAM-dependent methyltransferase [Paenibacillus xerothermodurans]